MRTLIQLIFTFIIALSIWSCGGDSKSNTADNDNKPVPTFKMANDNKTVKPAPQASKTDIQVPTVENVNTTSNTNNIDGLTDGQRLNSVPNACSLITVDDISNIFGISADQINQRDASHTKSPFTRSCFFRWEGASPNTGILVQVQANPVQEEYAEWISLFVSSKRTSGEREMGSEQTFKYEKMEGLGDDGSYSHRLGKYVWRDGNKYAFMIAFNTNSAKEVQMEKAKAIGNIMMKNYKN